MHPTKLLLLDGIGGVPLGREIAEALQADGHDVVHFDCLEQQARRLYTLRSAYTKVINKHAQKDGFYLLPKLDGRTLKELAKQARPTHILVVGFIYKFFDPRELQEIAATQHAQLMLYDTDSCNLYSKRREFIFFIEHELPVYTHIFSFSQVTTRFFQNTLHLPAVYLPFGARPITITDSDEKPINVLFVGSGDFRRILLLETIKQEVSVHGNRWRRSFPLISPELRERITDTSVWGDALHTLLARSKIVLNITRTDFFGAETGVSLRIFEAVAAGRFLLTDYCEEIEDLFEIGREIEVFRSSQELADKVRFYLENDEKRLTIAQHGYERFLQCHTWRERVRRLVGE